jgi:hypothetical protein
MLNFNTDQQKTNAFCIIHEDDKGIEELCAFISHNVTPEQLVCFPYKQLLIDYLLYMDASDDPIVLVALSEYSAYQRALIYVHLKKREIPIKKLLIQYIMQNNLTMTIEYYHNNISPMECLIFGWYAGNYDMVKRVCDNITPKMITQVFPIEFMFNTIIWNNETYNVDEIEETENHVKCATCICEKVVNSSHEMHFKTYIQFIGFMHDAGFINSLLANIVEEAIGGIIKYSCEKDTLLLLTRTNIYDKHALLWAKLIGQTNAKKCFEFLYNNKVCNINEAIIEAITADNAGILKIADKHGYKFTTEHLYHAALNSPYCFEVIRKHVPITREIFIRLSNNKVMIHHMMHKSSHKFKNDPIKTAIDSRDMELLICLQKFDFKITDKHIYQMVETLNLDMLKHAYKYATSMPTLDAYMIDPVIQIDYLNILFQHDNITLTPEAHKRVLEVMPLEWIEQVYKPKFGKN